MKPHLTFLVIMTTLLFFFVIMNHHYDSMPWREVPADGYTSYQQCLDGQMDYRMNDEPGVFSECYAKEVHNGQ